MKIKYKLSIMVIAIVAFVVTGISLMLLNQASGISMRLSLQSKYNMAERQAELWGSRQGGHMRVLQTLANIMQGYESLTETRRRENYNEIMQRTLEAEPIWSGIFTVWMPNAIDGMDQFYIGRSGSTTTGQYAIQFTKESGGLQGSALTGTDFENAMAHITGTNSNRNMVEHPVPRKVGERDTHVVIMRTPIVNPDTKETVGIVGCVLPFDAIQTMVQEVVRSHEEIAAMSVFSGNGTIMGHIAPERVGRMLMETETFLGDGLQDANQSVREGRLYQQSSYSPLLGDTLEIVIVPFNIGNSDTTWSIMIGTLQSYIMRDVNRMTLYTIVVAITALLIAAVIVFVVLQYTTKPIVKVTETLKNISQGDGDLTQQINVNSKDEIGSMARYFNLTLEKIKIMVRHVMNETRVITDMSSSLANNMTETAAAMNQITANIQSIKQRMVNQSASVTETNATMEQISNNINSLNGQVEKQTINVTQSSSAIEEMLANIQSVTQTLVKNTDNVEKLSEASDVGRAG